MANVPLMESENPKRFRSLASYILSYHRALTVDEMVGFLGLSRNIILRRAKKGTIPSFKVGGTVLFDPENVAHWLKSIGVQRASERRKK